MRYLMVFAFALCSLNLQAFDSFEHIWMGDEIELPFPAGPQRFEDYPYSAFESDIGKYFYTALEGRSIRKQYLDFAGYKISLGEMIAFAGDYFTAPNLIISDGISEKELEESFLLAFSTMVPTTQRGDVGPASVTDYLKHHGHYSAEVEEAFKEHKDEAREWQIFPNPFYDYTNSKRSDLYTSGSHEADTFPMLEALRKMVREEFGAIIKESAKAKVAAGNYIASKKGASEVLPSIVENGEGSLEILSDVHTALIKTKSFVDKVSGVLSDYMNGDPTYEFSKILSANLDHFGDDAMKVYTVGHHLAMQQARAAGAKNDVRGLNFAYALDGFAMHFLTDLFSAGHMRVPRRPLYEAYGAVRGGTPANAMHDEDGYFGLRVQNKKHTSWVAYGDYAYFSPRCKDANRQIYQAIKASIKEVWDSYLHAANGERFEALQYIPHLREDDNHFPLFKFMVLKKEFIESDVYTPNTTPGGVARPSQLKHEVIKVRANLENIHDSQYHDFSYQGPRAVSWSWFQSYLPSSIGVLAINQWEKYNQFDFRSVINKDNSKNLVATRVDFECHLTSEPETKSALVSDYAFSVDLKAQNFKGFKKRQKMGAIINAPKEGTFAKPALIVEEHEAKEGGYFVISDAVAKQIVRSCFVLTKGKVDTELYTVSAISRDTHVKAANLAISDAAENTSDGLLEEFPLHTVFP